jgi:hypothetical protein
MKCITLQLLSQNQHYITITITCILESNALHYNYFTKVMHIYYTLHFINFIIKRNIYTTFYTEILVTIK